MSERFCLANDDDGHWYVIPVAKHTAFENYVESVGTEDYGPLPEWATELGHHPIWISFENWRSELRSGTTKST